MDAIPIWAIFAATIIVVIVAIEAGYQFGRAMHRRSEDEKESPVSAIAGAILGLAAFMLAFTFGIVSERYDARKGLVRDDAIAIRTAWKRSDFLPETDRAEAAALLRQYVDMRVKFADVLNLEPESVKRFLSETQRIQDRLWNMAVANARKDMNSDVAALYIDSLNAGERDSCVESGGRDSGAGSQRDLARALLHHDSRHDERRLSDGNRRIETVHGGADPGPVVRAGVRADRLARSP